MLQFWMTVLKYFDIIRCYTIVFVSIYFADYTLYILTLDRYILIS